MSATTTSEYKLVLLGDGGVGKTTYVKKLFDVNFSPLYVPTLGVEVHPVNIDYNGNKIIFNMWDIAGQEKFEGLGDGYCIGANCAIIMLSDNKLGLKQLHNYKKMVLDNCGNIPIIIVFNKAELHKTVQNYDALMGTIPNKIMLCSSKNDTQSKLLNPLFELADILRKEKEKIE